MRMFDQRDSLLMSLGVLHRTRSASATEEVEDSVQRLLRMVQHVSKCPALTVLKKSVAGCRQFDHSVPLVMCRSQTAQRRGKDPSNGAIQSGYIYILRLP